MTPPVSNSRGQQSISHFFSKPAASPSTSKKDDRSSSMNQASGLPQSKQSAGAGPKRIGNAGISKLQRFANSKMLDVAQAEVRPTESISEERAEKRRKIAGESISSRREIAALDFSAKGDNAVDDDGDVDDEAEEEAESKPVSRKSSRGVQNGPSKSHKLTPLTQQYIDIKKNHMDTILAVEVGYKYHFYGEDATIVSKELNIFRVPGWNTIDEGTYLKIAGSDSGLLLTLGSSFL